MRTASSNSHSCPKSSGETVSFSTVTATAACTLAKAGSGGGIFLRRAHIAAAFSSANGDSTRYLSLTPSPPLLPASPSHNPFSSLLLYLPPFIAAYRPPPRRNPLSPIHPSSSPFSHSSPASPTPSSSSLLLPPPSFPRSSQPPAFLPWSLPLLHFITAPAPCRPRKPPSPSSDPNRPISIFLRRARQPPLHYPAPAPTAPISIFLLQPRQPSSPSSTPLLAFSIHLPLRFPTS
nr:PREDICTED: vegetative cell wall protein gp1-like [Musa acuminata subsp. malaccensis]